MANLSLRLQAILAFVQPCELLADIGTDHALVPVEALKRGLTSRAIGVDVNQGPLEATARRLRYLGQLGGVELIQSDGLSALNHRGVDCIVIAGMSAREMMRICTATPEVTRGAKQLIFQPNTEVHELRKWARELEAEHSFALHLVDEIVTYEGERFFTTLKFSPGVGEDPAYERSCLRKDEAYRLGPLLVERPSLEVRAYFEQQCERLSLLVENGAQQHAESLQAFERGLALIPRQV